MTWLIDQPPCLQLLILLEVGYVACMQLRPPKRDVIPTPLEFLRARVDEFHVNKGEMINGIPRGKLSPFVRLSLSRISVCNKPILI